MIYSDLFSSQASQFRSLQWFIKVKLGEKLDLQLASQNENFDANGHLWSFFNLTEIS